MAGHEPPRALLQFRSELEILYSVGRQARDSGPVMKANPRLCLFLLAASIVLPCTLLAQRAPSPIPADKPVSRTDQNSLVAHAQLLEKARKGGIDIYFEGDSITRRWGATDYPDLLAIWNQNFFGWNAANFGWGADTIQNAF